MADKQDLDAGFEAYYNSTIEKLTSQDLEDSRLESWKFVEEVRGNTGADGYFPEWLLPYSAFVSQITDRDEGTLKIRAAILRAAQLGYTEGYFAGKDD
ncbi:MAG: hypothetical protein O2821_06990 [Chloroflexi bacterium]|nr:hypothetical protein [Chloroflexota bacterium]MDA1228742.1 hypothetical protein [Chloroflexota bacterium]